MAWLLDLPKGFLGKYLHDRRRRTHFRAEVGHYDVGAVVTRADGESTDLGVNSLVVSMLYLPGARALLSDPSKNNDNPFEGLDGLRCEVNRRWRCKRYRASKMTKVNQATIMAEFPQGFTGMFNGKRRLKPTRPLIVRWRIDGKELAIARRTVGYDGFRYREHRGLILWRGWLKVLHYRTQFREKIYRIDQELGP